MCIRVLFGKDRCRTLAARLGSAGITAAVLWGLMAGALPGQAADIQRWAPSPDPYASPAWHDWSGPFAGLHLGYGWGKSRSTFGVGPGNANYDIDGIIGGGFVGWNFQSAPWVMGIVGDISGTGIDGDTVIAGVAADTEVNWLATVRGRFGYAYGPVLPYMTGGLAIANADAKLSGALSGSDSNTHLGWTIGAGLDWAISDRISAKVEYLYMDFERKSYNLGAVTARGRGDLHTVKAGVSWHFGGF